MTRTFLTTGLIAALTVTTLAGAAFAHQRGGPDGPRPGFEELDANSDGKVTAEELAAHRTARFAAADANGDGQLSVEEMAAQARAKAGDRAERRIAKRTERMIERMDSNGDSLLSLEEIAAHFDGSRMIERFDTDGDGAVSKAEFAEIGEGRGWRGKKGHGDRPRN